MIYDIQKSILYALFVYLIDTNERSFRYIMSGSTFGTLFRVTTWGESHGPGVGVVIDGCPAGIPLSEQDIQQFLDRRKPGQSKYTTKRNESDSVEILSGVFEGTTTGTPILFSCGIRISVPEIMGILRHLIVRDTQITALIRNMVSVITVAVDVLPAVRRSAVLLPVQLLQNYLAN